MVVATDLNVFIDDCEVVLMGDLQPLRDFIITETMAVDELDLDTFLQHVIDFSRWEWKKAGINTPQEQLSQLQLDDRSAENEQILPGISVNGSEGAQKRNASIAPDFDEPDLDLNEVIAQQPPPEGLDGDFGLTMENPPDINLNEQVEEVKMDEKARESKTSDLILEEQKEHLRQTRDKYQKILDSGKIKDERKKDALLKMVKQLEAQLEELENFGSPLAELEASVQQDSSKQNLLLSNPSLINLDSSQNSSPPKKLVPKKHKPTLQEHIDHAYREIHTFYSRQQVKNGILFDDQIKV